MYNPQTILLIGIITTCVLAMLVAFKLLRNDKLLIILFVLTLLFSIYGITIRDKVPTLKGGHPIDNWFSPLILISLYGILRYIYKRIYKIEPTYDHGWSYDFGDNRALNAFDVIVHLVPFFLALILPLIF